MKATTAICLAAMLGGAVLMTPPTFAESPTKAAFIHPGPGPSSVRSPPNVRRVQDNVSEFPQPEVRQSQHRILETTLHARIADNQMTDQSTGETRTIHTATFEGTIPGPTLVDHLRHIADNR